MPLPVVVAVLVVRPVFRPELYLALPPPVTYFSSVATAWGVENGEAAVAAVVVTPLKRRLRLSLLPLRVAGAAVVVARLWQLPRYLWYLRLL